MTPESPRFACKTRGLSPRAARLRRALPALLALVVAASAAIPAAAAAQEEGSRDRSTPWSGVFSVLRPLQPLDTHRVIVLFDAPSLGQWQAAADAPLTPREQKVFLRRATEQQDL